MTPEPTGTLDKAQLEALWVEQGGKASAKHTAAAIALAESSGNVTAEGHNTNGSIDRGLWQINSVHGALSTTNPRANARSAIAISNNGTNWSPWVTYQTGAYKTFLGAPNANESGTPNAATTNTTQPTTGNPLIPAGKGTGNALKYLAYALLFAIGAAVLYMGVKRTAAPHAKGDAQ